MSIYPRGEDIKKAIKWISEERQRCCAALAEKSDPKLIEEACIKFDLSPNAGEFLLRCLKEQAQEQKV